MSESGIRKFEKIAPLLGCPLCGNALSPQNGASLVCIKGHCFDVAKKGYVNFAPQKKHRMYEAALFESRQRAFLAGFYETPLQALCEVAARHIGTTAPVLVDAGCGEGYYALGIRRFFGEEAEVFGLDIEKDAIHLAARGGNDVKWLVADLSRIPLKDGCVDAVFNIFSPANYAEFRRVLKQNGIVVKAVPGEHYLTEIRQAAAEQLKSSAYSPARVADHFEGYLSTVERVRVKNTFPLTREQLFDFLTLTPMMFGVDKAKLKTEDIHEITIDVEILIGVYRG